MIKIKRIYEKSDSDDGYRILVDRLWPRGLSKEEADINIWIKEISPSTQLRKWFSHDKEKWEEFKKRYNDELKSKKDLLNEVKGYEKNNKNITLLFSSSNLNYNNAVALKEILES